MQIKKLKLPAFVRRPKVRSPKLLDADGFVTTCVNTGLNRNNS